MEENVKRNVASLAADLVCQTMCSDDLSLIALFQRNSPSERKTSLDVYGFVYGEEPLTPNGVQLTDIIIDVDTGAVKDLQVTETVEYTH